MSRAAFAASGKRWLWRTALFVPVFLLTPPGVSRAHDQPFSWADVHLEPDRMELRLTVHKADAASALHVATPDSLLIEAFLADRDSALAATLAGRIEFRADGRTVPTRWLRAEIDRERSGIALFYVAPWSRPPGRLDVRAHLFPEDPQHETFLNVYQGDRLLRQDVLEAQRAQTSVFTAGTQGVWAVLATFVPAGIHHIFIGPDHVLFIVGLLLLGGSLPQLLRIVTGFTIAHSITLALATLAIVQPPARIIEPLIALSIVYVGIDNLRAGPDRRDPRAWLAFAFGFVHGFGFASVLREFGLPREALAASLLGFNVGVEIGQACIVLMAAPLLAMLRARAPSFSPRLVTAASWLVVVAGAYWFVQRLLPSS